MGFVTSSVRSQLRRESLTVHDVLRPQPLLAVHRLLRRSLQQDGGGGEKVRYDYEDEVPVVVGISAEPRDMPNYDAGELFLVSTNPRE